MSKLARFREQDTHDADPIIRALQQQIQRMPPHEPEPGDADYIAPRRRRVILKRQQRMRLHP